MARIHRLATLALLIAGTAFAPSGAGALAEDQDTPLDKALQEVEALLAGLRGQQGADAKLIERLEEIAANLRKEKETLAARTPGAAPPAVTGNPNLDNAAWQWAKDTFFQGLDLKEEEKSTAEQILTEFCLDYKLAKDASDEKSKPVVRDHTEKRIARTFTPREANKMKDNLDTLIKKWEWAGGRRGR